jgi:putative membrane protein
LQLTSDERRKIDQCVAAFEARTGTQVVAAVVDKSDDYPEIPWKAFALGVSVTALLLLAIELMRPDWPGAWHTLVSSVTSLGAGAGLALVTLRSAALARLFLSPVRAEAEVFQHAQGLFVRHGLFRTRDRNGLLILVSRFERRVVILPDAALEARVGRAELKRIVDEVSRMLAENRVCDGLCGGIASAAALVARAGFVPSGATANEIPDRVVEESGARGRD